MILNYVTSHGVILRLCYGMLIWLFSILANSVGMFIGKPLTPFQTMRSPEQDIREITNYFHEKKNLQLIIVVLPDRTDRAYSKYT